MSNKYLSDFPDMPKSFQPEYQDNHNFQTNAKSFFHYLGKSNKFLEILSERIEEYDETLDNSLENLHNILNDYSDQWDENLETINDDVVAMMVEWMNDGTLADIINNDILQRKAEIIVSTTEPINVGQNTFWYHDVGESQLNLEGMIQTNVAVEENEPDNDMYNVWFDY